MRRHSVIVLLVLIMQQGFGQIRLGKLNLAAKETYKIQGTDIMVVDTLVLNDSARILLNSSKKDNFIHVKKLIAGKGVVIGGRGLNGTAGRIGASGISGSGPCRSGTDGLQGSPGVDGVDANNLFLYVDELVITGTLIIDLTGGDGGVGGKGGTGGDGSSGTKLCAGGSGGAGGPGLPGGNGGNGGSLTITSPFGTELRPKIGDRILVKSFGGFSGQAGDGGQGGQRGLGPLKDGNQGKKGNQGSPGKAGKPGGIFFERK